MRTRSYAPILATLLAVLACEPQPSPPPYSAMGDVKTLMQAVVEPAAEVYWDAVGTIDDSSGTTYLAPRNDAAWDAVRHSAIVVGESGNLLMMPPRAVDQKEWILLARRMTDASREALAAAVSRDTSRVFSAGAALYDTCTACHAKYSPEILRPSSR